MYLLPSFPDPGTPSLVQVESFFLPVFYQINSKVSLSGNTSIVLPRESARLISSSRQFMSFNTSAKKDHSTQYPLLIKFSGRAIQLEEIMTYDSLEALRTIKAHQAPYWSQVDNLM